MLLYTARNTLVHQSPWKRCDMVALEKYCSSFESIWPPGGCQTKGSEKKWLHLFQNWWRAVGKAFLPCDPMKPFKDTSVHSPFPSPCFCWNDVSSQCPCPGPVPQPQHGLQRGPSSVPQEGQSWGGVEPAADTAAAARPAALCLSLKSTEQPETPELLWANLPPAPLPHHLGGEKWGTQVVNRKGTTSDVWQTVWVHVQQGAQTNSTRGNQSCLSDHTAFLFNSKEYIQQDKTRAVGIHLFLIHFITVPWKYPSEFSLSSLGKYAFA